MKSYKDHLENFNTHSNQKKILLNKPVFRSSAIFPIKLKSSLNVNILFLGYWFLKRNIQKIKVLVSVRKISGELVVRETMNIFATKAYNISVKAILKKNNINNFDLGSIELEVFSLENLFYAYPAFVVNYFNKKFSTFVHTCGRNFNDYEDAKTNTKILVPETGFDILPNDDLIPFFSFVNSPEGLKNVRLKLKFINYLGENFIKKIVFNNISPYETKFVYLLNSKEKNFFKNKKGTVVIHHPFKNFFPRFLAGNINLKNHITSLTHTYYDNSVLKNIEEKYFWKNPKKSLFYDSVVAVPIFHNKALKTELAIYPSFVFRKIKLGLIIYDENGLQSSKINSILNINKKINKPIYLDINQILKKNKILLNSTKFYYAKIIIDGGGKAPDRFKFGLNICHDYKFKIPSNVCFSAQLPNLSTLNKKSTFKWGPILNKFNSLIVISNISPLKSKYKKATLNLKFWNEYNQECIMRKIKINNNGSYWYYLSQDKEIKNFLKNKSGWVTVHSDNPFVNGWYFEFSKYGVVGADHLF